MAWLCPELPRGNPLYHQWAHCQPEHPSNMVPLSSLPTATTHPEFILFDIDSLSRLFILSIKKIKQTFLALFSLTITSVLYSPSILPPSKPLVCVVTAPWRRQHRRGDRETGGRRHLWRWTCLGLRQTERDSNSNDIYGDGRVLAS